MPEIAKIRRLATELYQKTDTGKSENRPPNGVRDTG
jgi:hypothetical protein